MTCQRRTELLDLILLLVLLAFLDFTMTIT